MAISIDYARAQEEMMRHRYWEEQQRHRMAMQPMYYDDNKHALLAAGERLKDAVKEAPKLVPSTASDPLAFMDNKANKVLLTQGEI
jgi:hypothetical protein